jgi:flagellar basal-body rod protein FlgF
MDRLIYIAMTGAKHALSRQAATAHNLANVNTDGFRAQLNAFRALPVVGPGMPTRAYAVDSTVGSDFRPGPIDRTHRALDVALQGRGWLAVQGPDGREAYTRAGSLELNANGQLQTRAGFNVLGEAGPITIPPETLVSIERDGTVSTVPAIGAPNVITIIGRIKLVDPPESDLQRGADGLFRLPGGAVAPAAAGVGLVPGAVERSNVSAVASITDIIGHARQFEMQLRLIQNADQNARQLSQLFNLNA